jgi:hypothetical protein
MRSTALILALILVAPLLVPAQVPGGTAESANNVHLSLTSGALAHPFPSFQAPADLATWVAEAKGQADRLMWEARSRRDGDSVAIVLSRLQKARYHAFRELEKIVVLSRDG